MNRFLAAACTTLAATTLVLPALADNPPAGELLDKAIKALGGQEKLDKAKAVTWKSKAKITIEGNENDMSIEGTAEGPDHYRTEFQGEFNGNNFKGVTVVVGDKGWRKFGDMLMELDADALKNEKRTIYLALMHINPAIVKSKGFKVEAAEGAEIQGKPADGLKVTGPDGKESTLYISRETGLPVRQVAKVVGWMGEEYTQEATYNDYKEFDGVKVPTKIVIKRDGEDFVTQNLSEVKLLDKAPEGAFAEPK